jgi:predicted SAM-dependent methyltransferase
MKVLHVGCGYATVPEIMFPLADWSEIRLDIDPDVNPDIVASLTKMPVADAAMQAIFSAHNLEHLAPHDVPVALAEFRRVLSPGGFALIQVPDLQAAARDVADGKGHVPIYDAPCGPVAAFDMIFGHGRLASDNHWMAHRCGFTADTLYDLLIAAGFPTVTVRASNYTLDAVAVKDGL